MPLPLILGVGAAIAAATGVGTGIHGAAKMKDANDTMKLAQQQNEANVEKFKKRSESCNSAMDSLGELELTILSSFENFSNVIEKIQGRPEFKSYHKDGVKLPEYNKEELKNVSVGAGVLLGGLGGAAAGAAGGFAAAGATTSAVMALGTASTGTAIASLSGVAATNATLAALGGGAIAAGGGGMALGTTILGASTLGVGLLIGGIIFNATGSKLSDKADQAYNQMKQNERLVNKICDYLDTLQKAAIRYSNSLMQVREEYLVTFKPIARAVAQLGKTNWEDFTPNEQLAIENAVLLVGLQYEMCKVKLVLAAENEEEINSVNQTEINTMIDKSKSVLNDLCPC